MSNRKLTALTLAFVLVLVPILGAAPAAADTAGNDPLGPNFLNDDGDDSLVDDVTPDFVGGLLDSLPVPESTVKKFN